MNKEDKKFQKHLVDEMMQVYETNPNVMLYMEALMKKYEELEQENKQLKKRNKEIYDGFIVAIDEVCETDREKREYKQKIDKAIEYIKNNSLYYENYDYNEEDELELKYVYDDKAREDLLEILGDKENE